MVVERAFTHVEQQLSDAEKASGWELASPGFIPTSAVKYRSLQELRNKVDSKGLGQMGSRLNQPPHSLCPLNWRSCVIGASFGHRQGSHLYGIRTCFHKNGRRGCCCLQLTKELVRRLDKECLSKDKAGPKICPK